MKPPIEAKRDTNAPADFLSSLVESTDDAIFGTDLDGIIVSWNRAAEELYGYTAQEIVGRPASILTPPDREGEVERKIEQLKRQEKMPHYETLRLRKDRKLVDLSIRISLVRNSSGSPTGIAIIARDITEQKRAQETAALASRMKQQFLDNMNHEIRTPLNGILGMTDLVLDSQLTSEQRESLGLVKISAESLLAAIDDVLDFSQIEAGKLRLEAIPFDLRESLGDTMKILGFRAQNKGLELIYEIEPEIPSGLVGDPGRLRRVLHNVVGNAIKFTQQGEILVSVRVQARETGNIVLKFSVKDTGIGIPKDKQAVLFTPFSQVDGSSTRRYGGTGLGLAIVQKLVELMEGDLWVESEEGVGSNFHFTIRFQLDESSPAHAVHVDISQLHDVSALIVDDNSVNRRVMRRMLNRWGMRTSDVADGEAALHALRIAKDIGHPFALVILDGHMRQMDGFAIAEEIRNDPGIAGATIMMLTSVGHVGEAARCRDLGIAAYLVKPIRLSELADAICLAMKKASEGDDAPLVTRHFLREARTRMHPPMIDG